MQVKLGGSMQYKDMGRHDMGLRVNGRGFGGSGEEGMTYVKMNELRILARKAGRLVAPRHEKTLAIIMLNCVRCGTEFMKTHSRMKYCSPICQHRDAHERERDKSRPNRVRKVRTHSGPIATINTCGHPERQHMAKGYCRPCYGKIWKKAKRASLRLARLQADGEA